jgi:hypothetical protein
MPTATFAAKNIQCDGQTYEIRQNRHRNGAPGSAWIPGAVGSGVKPNDLPNAWKQAIAPALSAADNIAEFQKEIQFSAYLSSKGANNIGQADPADRRIMNRWRSLRARFGENEVRQAPGGNDAMDALQAEPIPAHRTRDPYSPWQPLN